jgi:hypothetical protein
MYIVEAPAKHAVELPIASAFAESKMQSFQQVSYQEGFANPRRREAFSLAFLCFISDGSYSRTSQNRLYRCGRHTRNQL